MAKKSSGAKKSAGPRVVYDNPASPITPPDMTAPPAPFTGNPTAGRKDDLAPQPQPSPAPTDGSNRPLIA